MSIRKKHCEDLSIDKWIILKREVTVKFLYGCISSSMVLVIMAFCKYNEPRTDYFC